MTRRLCSWGFMVMVALAFFAPRASAQTDTQTLDALYRQARERPDQALRTLQSLPGAETPLRRRLRALALSYGGRDGEALALYPAGLADSPEGLLVRGLVARRADRHAEAVAATEQALAALTDCPAKPSCDLGLAFELWAINGEAHHTLGQLGPALKAHSQSLAMAQALADVHRQARSLGDMALSHRMRDEAEAARQLLRSAMGLQGLDGPAQGWLNILVAVLARDAGAWDEHRQALERALQLAEQHDAPFLAMATRANLADHWLQNGKPQLARELALKVLAAPEAAREPVLARAVRTNLTISLVQLHEFTAARVQGAELAVLQQRAPPRERLQALRELSMAWAQARQWADALRYLHAERQLGTEVRERELAQVLDDQRKDQASARQQAELELLKEQDALHQRTLENQRVLRWIGVLASTLVGLGLLFAVLFWVSTRAAHSRLRRSQARLKGLTDHDALTGLLNRRAIQDVMATRDPEHSGDGGWLLLDIDHFKRINDQHGHAVGDQVLHAVAQRLSTQVRGGDLLARWGGEEFLLHAPGVSLAELRHLAQRLMRTLTATPVALEGGGKLAVTASMGFAVFPLPPDRPAFGWERAVNWVDMALYSAKNAGRECAVGIVEARLSDAAALERIEADFERAAHAARVHLVQVRASDA